MVNRDRISVLMKAFKLDDCGDDYGYYDDYLT